MKTNNTNKIPKGFPGYEEPVSPKELPQTDDLLGNKLQLAPTLPLPVADTSRLTEAKKRLETVSAYYMQFAGQKGHNPYFYLTRIVRPLQAAFNEGKITEELLIGIDSLVMEPPTLESLRHLTTISRSTR